MPHSSVQRGYNRHRLSPIQLILLYFDPKIRVPFETMTNRLPAIGGRLSFAGWYVAHPGSSVIARGVCSKSNLQDLRWLPRYKT